MIFQVVVVFDFEDEEGLRQRWMACTSSQSVLTRAKAEVVIAEVERRAPRAEHCRRGRSRSHGHRRQMASPSSRTMSARAKAVVDIAEVEGEPLEPNCVGEGEGRS